MKLRCFPLLVAALLAIGVNGNAQQLQAQQSDGISPYIESGTLGVIDIDITKIDVEALAKWTLELSPAGNKDVAKQQAIMGKGLIDSLKAAGVSHVYMTGATQSVTDGGPLFVVPCENTSMVQGLAAMLLNGSGRKDLKVHTGDNVLVGGAGAAVDRVVDGKGVDRADLTGPLSAQDRLDHTMVIALPKEAREELALMWPDRLDDRAPIQLSPKEMVRDIDRIVVSVNLPPEPQVRISIDTADAEATERVKVVVDRAIANSPEVAKSVDVVVSAKTITLSAAPETIGQLAKDLSAPARASADRMVVINNLKQLGLAMHNYYATNDHLPPRCLTDREGRALHSWRVTVLPYMEQAALHKSIQLDKPWNDAANKTPVETVIPQLDAGNGTVMTRFRAPVFPGSLWHGDGPPRKFRDVIDGTSNTIAAIYAPADAAVEWANPEPWVLDEDDPISSVFGDRDIVMALMLDGSVLTFSRKDLDNAKLKAYLTFAGKELIE